MPLTKKHIKHKVGKSVHN